MPLKVSLRSEAGENSSEPCQIRRLERAPAKLTVPESPGVRQRLGLHPRHWIRIDPYRHHPWHRSRLSTRDHSPFVLA